MLTASGSTTRLVVSGRPSRSAPSNMAGRLAMLDWVETATACAGSTARAKANGPTRPKTTASG